MRTLVFTKCILLAVSCAFAQAQTAATTATAEPQVRLAELLKQAGEVPEKDYTIESWNGMRLVLSEARRVANNKSASQAELNEAFEKLSQAVSRLEKRTIVPLDLPPVGLSASIFATSPSGTANNVSLMWSTAEPCERFELQRAASEDGPFTTIYTGTGASFADQGLSDGKYFYRLIATRNGSPLTSHTVSVETKKLPGGLKQFSNQTPNREGIYQPLKVGDTYYTFDIVRDGKALKHVIMGTSKDGKTWQGETVVMDVNSHPDLADFKFEANTFFYDKVHDQIVWWCHWEKSGPSYSHGRAMAATAKPGQPFKVHRIFNPMGIEVRDMSVFVDDDNTGYLVAASNVPGQGANATLYIFKLNEDYTDVVEIVAKVAENGYREAPHILKKDGIYYLFFSQAAGWYPSRGGYASARSLAGPWSELRSIGNPSTFSSQSGGILKFGDAHVPVMMGNRWIRGEGTSRNAVLPIGLSDGFAFYDYAPTLLHDASRSLIIPLQAGELLSQDKPVEASIPGSSGHEATKAFDGDYFSAFQSDQKQWPFTLTTDLGRECDVRNVQISWHIHKGSEAFYTYSIEGSSDGKEWRTLLDRTDQNDNLVSKTYGFTSDLLPEGSKARYVRVNVKQAHLHNNPNNWYPPTVYEVKVFGKKG